MVRRPHGPAVEVALYGPRIDVRGYRDTENVTPQEIVDRFGLGKSRHSYSYSNYHKIPHDGS